MYRLTFDLHTHTPYSHGKSTVMQNADAAERRGLHTLGISDHGPGHKFFGINLREVSLMRRDIEEARRAHPGLEILLGVEANIINPSGNLDVSAEQQKLFDYILAGYHYGIFGEEPVKGIGTIVGGYIHNLTGRSTVRAKNYNTDLVVAALCSNRIKMLTHPGDKAAFDIDVISRACENTGTWMEINCHHNGLSVEGIRTAAKYDVTFAISSDAHLASNVGVPDAAIKRAQEAGLDLRRIVNLEDDQDSSSLRSSE